MLIGIETPLTFLIQGEPKNRTFVFFVKNFPKFFFQKPPTRGIFMRFLKKNFENFLPKKRKVRFFSLPCKQENVNTEAKTCGFSTLNAIICMLFGDFLL
jgi:hypothetical protein